VSLKRAVLALALVAPAAPAAADPSSGVDAALFRQSYDTGGVFTLEGARLMPVHDISWKVLTSYAQSPLDVAVPGIGAGPDDTTSDSVLGRVIVVDMAFGMSITEKLAIGLDVAAYRATAAEGYGKRGTYSLAGSSPSTGVQALRPLSNIDPAGGFAPDGLAGPLDARLGLKLALVAQKNLAATVIATASLPFGEDEMLLGDRSFVFEPRIAIDYRFDLVRATKLVLNAGARIRERTVLEAYDTENGALGPEDARPFLDVGSEAMVGAGFLLELTQRAVAGLEAVAFYPLPEAIGFGSCRRYDGRDCSTIMDDEFWPGTSSGDPTLMSTIGLMLRLNPHVTATIQAGGGFLGARGDDFRLGLGVVWSPQPAGVAEAGRGDRDDDGIPDVSDGCKEEKEDKDGFADDDGCPDLDNDNDGKPDAEDQCVDQREDRDGYQDDDGCPELDNDGDGSPDERDRCPDQKEDPDGFEDDDGCLDEDNDGDGFADTKDKCPNDQETVNGIDDSDGCPDARGTVGPQETSDRIDLRGATIAFAAGGATLSGATRVVLGQVATLIKDRNLIIKVEVHVPLGTTSKNARQIAAQKKKDKELAQRRAIAIVEYLVSQGVPGNQLQAIGIGSDRPLGQNPPADPRNERVDLIKAQQRSP
jgi:flagellar motor protein MotB